MTPAGLLCARAPEWLSRRGHQPAPLYVILADVVLTLRAHPESFELVATTCLIRRVREDPSRQGRRKKTRRPRTDRSSRRGGRRRPEVDRDQMIRSEVDEMIRP